MGGDTGEGDPSGRCSPSLFGSSPRSAWKTSSANFASTEFSEVRIAPVQRLYGGPVIGPGLYAAFLCAFVGSKGYPLLSSHSPPERCLLREVPVVGHGDYCDDDPQQGAECEEKGEQGPPWRQRREDH